MIPIQYPNWAPITDVTVVRRPSHRACSGAARAAGMRSSSGGMIKQDDSVNDRSERVTSVGKLVAVAARVVKSMWISIPHSIPLYK